MVPESNIPSSDNINEMSSAAQNLLRDLQNLASQISETGKMAGWTGRLAQISSTFNKLNEKQTILNSLTNEQASALDKVLQKSLQSKRISDQNKALFKHLADLTSKRVKTSAEDIKKEQVRKKILSQIAGENAKSLKSKIQDLKIQDRRIQKLLKSKKISEEEKKILKEKSVSIKGEIDATKEAEKAAFKEKYSTGGAFRGVKGFAKQASSAVMSAVGLSGGIGNIIIQAFRSYVAQGYSIFQNTTKAMARAGMNLGHNLMFSMSQVRDAAMPVFASISESVSAPMEKVTSFAGELRTIDYSKLVEGGSAAEAVKDKLESLSAAAFAFGYTGSEIRGVERALRDVGVATSRTHKAFYKNLAVGSQIAKMLGKDVKAVSQDILDMSVQLRSARVGFSDVLGLSVLFAKSLEKKNSILKNLGVTSRDMNKVVSDLGTAATKSTLGLTAYLYKMSDAYKQLEATGRRISPLTAGLVARYGRGKEKEVADILESRKASLRDVVTVLAKGQAKQDFGAVMQGALRLMERTTANLTGGEKFKAMYDFLKNNMKMSHESIMFVLANYDKILKGELGSKELRRIQAKTGKDMKDYLAEVADATASLDDKLKVIQEAITRGIISILFGIFTVVMNIGTLLTFWGNKEAKKQVKKDIAFWMTTGGREILTGLEKFGELAYESGSFGPLGVFTERLRKMFGKGKSLYGEKESERIEDQIRLKKELGKIITETNKLEGKRAVNLMKNKKVFYEFTDVPEYLSKIEKGKAYRKVSTGKIPQFLSVLKALRETGFEAEGKVSDLITLLEQAGAKKKSVLIPVSVLDLIADTLNRGLASVSDSVVTRMNTMYQEEK